MVDTLKLQTEILEYLGRLVNEMAPNPKYWRWANKRWQFPVLELQVPSLYQKFNQVSAVDFIATLTAMIEVGLLEGDVKASIYYSKFQIPEPPASLSPDGPRLCWDGAS